MVNSRGKGKDGELELAHELERVLGVRARRGVQYRGGPNSPDIVTSLKGVHFECKRVERLGLYKALDQSKRDAGDDIPLVIHRANRRPWVVIVELENLPALAKLIHSLNEKINNENRLA